MNVFFILSDVVINKAYKKGMIGLIGREEEGAGDTDGVGSSGTNGGHDEPGAGSRAAL